MILLLACADMKSGTADSDGGPSLVDSADSAPTYDSTDSVPTESGDSSPGIDTGPTDLDGDGWITASDCDDSDATIHPGADEACEDGIDQDCDGVDVACELPSGDVTLADVSFVGARPGQTVGHELLLTDSLGGDDMGDVILPGYDGSGSVTGTIHVVYDPSSGVYDLRDADVTIEGNAEDDWFGYSVATADIDGDGDLDLVSGALQDDLGTLDGGAVYVFESPITATSASHADGVAYSTTTSEWVGYDIATVGDTDGDGLEEVLAGAAGGSSGMGGAWLLEAPFGDGPIDTSSVYIAGDSTSEMAGSATSAAGDLDGDGLADVLVTAFYYSGGSGRVGLFHGPISDTTMSDADTLFMDSATRSNFGLRAVAHDLDHDGNTDLVFSAPLSSASGFGSAGAVFVLPGPFTDSFVSAADATVSILGDADHAGAGMGLDAGDIDGDGQEDLLIGGSGLPVFGTYDGGAWVFYGPLASGTTSTAQTTWTASEAGQYVGFAADLHDLDGDGRSEVLLGGYGASPWGRSMAGMGWLFWGN